MENNYIRTAVFRTSNKENEKRLPLYPFYLNKIDKDLLSSMVFEEGYGTDYCISDSMILKLGGNIAPRKDLFVMCDLMLLPKPTVEDMLQMKTEQILCGWVHAVQQTEIAQIAIDKNLTLIAWENMNHWDSTGKKLLHVFHRNNELAGYAGILHFLELKGLDGHYGPRKQVAILGYGSVSRGAIYALQGRGFNNIHVYTQRPAHLVGNKNPDVWYKQMINKGTYIQTISTEGEISNMIDELSQADIIVNGVMQNVNDPTMFISNESELANLKPYTSIIDISCDEDMGFYFAKPTSFKNPVFTIGNNITYYSVDHAPSYLWNAASREISLSLQPYLRSLMIGKEGWEESDTLHKAIDIEHGIINNDDIIKFQHRENLFPYKIK